MGRPVLVHAWVLMTNHIHLLATPTNDDSVSRTMQYLGRNYVRLFNKRYRRTGTLWEGRFKSCIVDTDEYFFACQRYIELNPVRAGMVSSAEEYRWSSYRRNGLGHPDSLVVPSDLYLDLGKSDQERQFAYRELFNWGLAKETIEDIRTSTAKGLAFGSDRFKEQIETLHQRRVKSLSTGPRKQ